MEGEKFKPMKPDEYFPRPTRKPGVEPFEPPFTNAIKPEKGKVKRVCAYCGAELGEKEAVGGAESHGICAKCVAEDRSGLEALKKEKEIM